MPEAAVEKDGDFGTRKHEVCRAPQASDGTDVNAIAKPQRVHR